jgi:hypothetical protein
MGANILPPLKGPTTWTPAQTLDTLQPTELFSSAVDNPHSKTSRLHGILIPSNSRPLPMSAFPQPLYANPIEYISTSGTPLVCPVRVDPHQFRHQQDSAHTNSSNTPPSDGPRKSLGSAGGKGGKKGATQPSTSISRGAQANLLKNYIFLTETTRRLGKSKQEGASLFCLGVLYDNDCNYKKSVECYERFSLLCRRTLDEEGEV